MRGKGLVLGWGLICCRRGGWGDGWMWMILTAGGIVVWCRVAGISIGGEIVM